MRKAFGIQTATDTSAIPFGAFGFFREATWTRSRSIKPAKHRLTLPSG